MSKPKKSRKTLADQIADLDDPAPKDFDPEDAGLYNSESEASASENGIEEDNARAHYEPVGKSKLRKPEGVSLGPRYSGSRVSRDVVEGDDSDDPFSREYDDVDGEELEAASGVAQRSSAEEDFSEEENLSQDDVHSGSDTSGTEFSDDEGDHLTVGRNHEGQDSGIDRSELRKLMADDQKSVAAIISEGAKADAEKGRAVKKQRVIFDTLLNSRIKLQKALIAINSLAVVEVEDNEIAHSQEVISSAENAAMKLWNNLNSLSSKLLEKRTGTKRKHSEMKSDTPLSQIWKESQAYEDEQLPVRNSSINFWAAKCRATTTLPQARGRLNQTNTQQDLSDILAAQLVDMPRLVARTRVPRSCAPIQAASTTSKNPTSANRAINGGQHEAKLPIYDDADFYSTLLQTLITQRSSMSSQNTLPNLNNLNLQPWQAAREAKTKKVVDTKASKGRKLRYTVHEKLQNFMAAEDRGSWGVRQADELFGSLFGRRLELGEDGDLDGDDEGNGNGNGDTAEGLRLFAGP